MTDFHDLIPGLAKFSRVDLNGGGTPLQAAPVLGRELGLDLTVKRDDLNGLAFGGNKVRQLEYYLGPARDQGADCLLITGAYQSNFTRLTAAAARRLGMTPHIQLEARVPTDDPLYHRSGNVLVESLLGAQLTSFPEGENEAAADAALDARAEALRATGHKPFVIHLGIDHPPLGGLGYAAAAAEVWRQCEQSGDWPDLVVLASGSGLTHAGFLVGCRALGWPVPITGICVRRDAAQQQVRIAQRAAELAAMIGREGLITAGDVRVSDSVLAPGYGQLNPQVGEALKLAAECEAILLDPVYTGRCLAGLIHLTRAGDISRGAKVLFIHTGGLPALFAYQNLLEPQLASPRIA